ncbi:MAG: 3-dehydroquinate synthase [Deltaproteobacteria bacterium]|nr:3-dehydroquinate synthase [Deltaproteobacteria bacterium]
MKIKTFENTSPTAFDSSSNVSSVENALGWPHGTLAVLEQAFLQKLDRHTLWDLSNVSNTAPFEKAASVFLRGVRILGKDETARKVSPTPLVTSKAMSEIFDQEYFVVSDARVLDAWPFLKQHTDLALEVSELTKNLETVSRVLKGVKTRHPWLIIGGGITCDLTAFAASQVGVSFSLVPTTLLSMVDACIGGKTGVNVMPYGKNLVGSFAFPDQVYLLTDWLKTLPERDLRSGCGECFKHALLLGDLNLLETLAVNFAKKDFAKLGKHLPALIRLKEDIVARDPFEKGERVILNLGHTLAHALEAVSMTQQDQARDTIAHGEAVSIGLLFSLLASVAIGLWERKGFDRVHSYFQSAGCLLSKAQLQVFMNSPLGSDELFSKLLHHMSFDKKKQGHEDHAHFVLLKAPGQVHLHQGKFLTPLSPPLLRKVWGDLLNIMT